MAGTDHTVCTAATAGKQGSVASVRRADRSGARRIQHVCKCNVDPVKRGSNKVIMLLLIKDYNSLSQSSGTLQRSPYQTKKRWKINKVIW